MNTDWQTKFYGSKQWKHARAAAIHRDKGVCQSCKEVIIGSCEVHHIRELTAENVYNPEISLNLDLLETLCPDCHNKRHGRFCAEDKIVCVDDELNIDYTKRGST